MISVDDALYVLAQTVDDYRKRKNSKRAVELRQIAALLDKLDRGESIDKECGQG